MCRETGSYQYPNLSTQYTDTLTYMCNIYHYDTIGEYILFIYLQYYVIPDYADFDCKHAYTVFFSNYILHQVCRVLE